MTKISTSSQVAAIIASVALVGLVVWLIRRGRIREETALYWLFATGVLLLFSLRSDLLGWTASLLGIFYPPTVLLLGVLLAGTLLAIHFSVSLTRLEGQNKRLAQELALLTQRIESREPSHPPEDRRP
jgi:hypothetical protein